MVDCVSESGPRKRTVVIVMALTAEMRALLLLIVWGAAFLRGACATTETCTNGSTAVVVVGGLHSCALLVSRPRESPALEDSHNPQIRKDR